MSQNNTSREARVFPSAAIDTSTSTSAESDANGFEADIVAGLSAQQKATPPKYFYDEAGSALFEEICQELNRVADANSYFHNWKPTDLLIWDNWRMLHAVEGCNPIYERRTQRTTIKGDYGLGYFEDGKKIGEVFREIEI